MNDEHQNIYVSFLNHWHFFLLDNTFYAEISESGYDIGEPLGKNRNLFPVLRHKWQD